MPKYRKRRGLPTALVYAGVVRTEGVGWPVREGGFSSFRTESFPQGHTFLCVASHIGDVLGVRTFGVLSRELEWLSPVCDKSNSYIRVAAP